MGSEPSSEIIAALKHFLCHIGEASEPPKGSGISIVRLVEVLHLGDGLTSEELIWDWCCAVDDNDLFHALQIVADRCRAGTDWCLRCPVYEWCEMFKLKDGE